MNNPIDSAKQPPLGDTTKNLPPVANPTAPATRPARKPASFKDNILLTIRRIAAANGTVPPGARAFERVTRIRRTDWGPHLWLRWGDAVEEAGFARNGLRKRIDDDKILRAYADLTQELRHLPLACELRRKAAQDKKYPCLSTFDRFGGKERLIQAVIEYCEDFPELADVLLLAKAYKLPSNLARLADGMEGELVTGFVYLVRSGRHWKIGRTKTVARREAQIASLNPLSPKMVHRIETDDPVGVEAYWHRRFAKKRAKGEWFTLDQAEIAAFKRWKVIV